MESVRQSVKQIRFLKCYWGDQIKKDEMVRACSTMGQMANSYTVLFEKPEKKRPLAVPRRVDGKKILECI